MSTVSAMLDAYPKDLGNVDKGLLAAHEHCRLCAEACRRCQQVCEDLLAALG